MTEEILIAADHAGFELKQKLADQLRRLGYAVRDLGTNSAESTDYPDYAHPLAKEVSNGKAKRGILVCGTGLGMSYVANRYANVRAAVVWTPEIAELSRSHNDANVLVLPSRFVDDEQAGDILKKWLETPFEGGRHERRVVKIEGQGEPRGARASKPKRQSEARAARASKPRAQSPKPKARSPKPKAKKATRKGKR